MKLAWHSPQRGRRVLRGATLALLSSLPLLLAAPAAMAQTVEDRLVQLERDVQNLERKVYRSDQSYPSGYQVPTQLAQNNGGYAVEDRMNGLEQQMSSLTGQIEDLQNRVQQLTVRLDKMTTDLEFRVSQLENGRSGGTPPSVAAAPPPSTGVPPYSPPGNTGFNNNPPPSSGGVLRPPPSGQEGYRPSVPAPSGPQVASAPAAGGSPEQQYEAAFQLLRANDYAKAEAAMRGFVQRNPKHPLASNAQFWLGETYWVRNDFQNAAAAYAEGYKNYPKGNKAPDTLLKLGMSLAALKKDPDACAVYDRLGKEFPQASDIVRRRLVEERKKSHCG